MDADGICCQRLKIDVHSRYLDHLTIASVREDILGIVQYRIRVTRIDGAVGVADMILEKHHREIAALYLCNAELHWIARRGNGDGPLFCEHRECPRVLQVRIHEDDGIGAGNLWIDISQVSLDDDRVGSVVAIIDQADRPIAATDA